MNLKEQRRLPSGRRTKPFNLAAGRLGTFPYDGPPRILYASVTEDLAQLHSLQIRVDELAKEAGLPPSGLLIPPPHHPGQIQTESEPQGGPRSR